MASRRWPTKLVMSWEAVGDVQLCTCNIYIYIVPPLGAYKSQLGGTYTLSLLVYTVNVSCDLIYIYVFHLFIFTGWCLLHD